MANKTGQQREVLLDLAETSIIRKFLRMNHPNFTISSVIEDFLNFMERYQNVYEVLHVADGDE